MTDIKLVRLHPTNTKKFESFLHDTQTKRDELFKKIMNLESMKKLIAEHKKLIAEHKKHKT